MCGKALGERAGGRAEGEKRAVAGLPKAVLHRLLQGALPCEGRGAEKRLFMIEDPGQPRECGMEALQRPVGAHHGNHPGGGGLHPRHCHGDGVVGGDRIRGLCVHMCVSVHALVSS